MDKIIFIVGNSRSGSTMISKIFDKHDNILVFKELHYFDLISTPDKVEYDYETALICYSKLLCVNTLEPWNIHRYKEFLDEAKDQLSENRKFNNYEVFKLFVNKQLVVANKQVAVEQTPRNANFVLKISENISNSYFIHIIRDPRDVLLSQKHKWKRNRLGGKMNQKEILRTLLNHNPIITSYIYKKTIEKLYLTSNQLVGNIMIKLKFEDVVDNPNVEIKKMFDFLNLDYKDEYLKISHSSSSFVSNTSHGINASRKDAWRKNINSAELSICQLINKTIILNENYKHEFRFPNIVLLLFYTLILPLQLFLIILFNLKLVIKKVFK